MRNAYLVRAIVGVFLLGWAVPVGAQFSSTPQYGPQPPAYREPAEQYPRGYLNSRGMFGARRFGMPLEPAPSGLFEGGGLRRSESGAFLGIDATAPGSMFSPIGPLEDTVRSSVPAQLPARAAGPLAETAPWPADRMPSAVPTGPRADAGPYGYDRPPDGWQRPPQTAWGPREEVWMRSPDGEPVADGPQGVPAAGAVPGVGPQGAFGPAAEAAPSATSQPPLEVLPAAENHRIALRLARMVVQTPGVQPVAPITVRYIGGVATIEGAVATDHGRELAAQVLRLDPLVREVRNQLQSPGVVGARPTTGAPLPVARPESYEAPLPPGFGGSLLPLPAGDTP